MSRYKYGNPKKQSRFICCKCLKENLVGIGIQRVNRQREKGHIKHLYCIRCSTLTPNLEVRYCDNFDEMMIEAENLHSEYEEKVLI